MGTYLIMALIEPIIAIIANWFIASNTIGLSITYALALVFVGLATYDTQKKQSHVARAGDGTERMHAKVGFIGNFHSLSGFSGIVLQLQKIPREKETTAGDEIVFQQKGTFFIEKQLKV